MMLLAPKIPAGIYKLAQQSLFALLQSHSVKLVLTFALEYLNENMD